MGGESETKARMTREPLQKIVESPRMLGGPNVDGGGKNVDGATEHRVGSAQKHEKAENVARMRWGDRTRGGNRVIFGWVDVKLFLRRGGRKRGGWSILKRRKDFVNVRVLMDENAVVRT